MPLVLWITKIILFLSLDIPAPVWNINIWVGDNIIFYSVAYSEL